MDPNTFDRISKRFMERRLSRRATMAGGTGLGAVALGAAALGSARSITAQDASPVASPVAAATKTEFLFVQSFETGSLTPKAGSDGEYVLELKEGLGQTLYFSDRPERIVGTTPTQTFLAQFPFGPENPPNAALVAETGDGNEEIVVVELTNPTYDEASKSATYDAKILDDATRVDMTFAQQTDTGPHEAATYGASNLFIDDCPNQYVVCSDANNQNAGDLGDQGYCWNWSTWICDSCQDYDTVCNQTFSSCDGNCTALILCGGNGGTLYPAGQAAPQFNCS